MYWMMHKNIVYNFLDGNLTLANRFPELICLQVDLLFHCDEGVRSPSWMKTLLHLPSRIPASVKGYYWWTFWVEF